MPIDTITQRELIELFHEMLAHLEYCGWGDEWERECSEDLQNRAHNMEARLTALEERSHDHAD